MDTQIILGTATLINSFDSFSGTLNIPYTNYVNGGVYLCLINSTNDTNTPTLNLNSIGIKTILSANGGNVPTNTFIPNELVKFTYDLVKDSFLITDLSIVNTTYSNEWSLINNYSPSSKSIFEKIESLFIGTPNFLPKFNVLGNGIENSQIYDDGTTVLISSQFGNDIFNANNIGTGSVSFGTASDGIPLELNGSYLQKDNGNVLNNFSANGFNSFGANFMNNVKLYVKSTSGTGFRYDSASQNNVFYSDNNGVVSALNGYSISGIKFINADNVSARNTIIGYTTAHNNINTFFDNTFIGRVAGDSTSGSANTFIGSYAGYNNTTGSNNVFLGGVSQNVTGSFNTILNSGGGNGNYNNIIGATAGAFGVGIGTSSNLVIIGCQTGILKANIASSIGFGYGHTITDSNQFVASDIKEVYFGNGVYTNSLNQAVLATNFRSANVGFITGNTHHTDGSCVESIITLNGGQSTGTGVGGSIQFKTAKASVTSGNTLNSLNVVMEIKSNGVVNIQNAPTSSLGLVSGDIWSNLGALTIV